MKNNLTIEIAVAGILVALIGILTYAHEAWMPDMATMLVLLAVVASFATFAVFVWKEKSGDERENLIRNIGSRVAFLATGSVLVIGIVAETLLYYAPNMWLSFALVTMVGAKIIGQAYGRSKH